MIRFIRRRFCTGRAKRLYDNAHGVSLVVVLLVVFIVLLLLGVIVVH